MAGGSVDPHGIVRRMFGAGGHGGPAVHITHFAAGYDVVDEAAMARVRGEREVRRHGAQMRHRCELNIEFARRMDGDAEAERLAEVRRPHAGAHAAPERRVEHDDLNRPVDDIGGELLDGANFAFAGLRVRMAEQDRRPIAELAVSLRASAPRDHDAEDAALGKSKRAGSRQRLTVEPWTLPPDS
jgi:hypothetical protein